ncbi:serine/threonine-protein kinase [Chloroflexota bacterium]
MATEQILKTPTIFTTTFATYTATAIIGEGGSGRIYKVADDSGESFAIKLLEPSRITKEKVKRFKNELSFCQKNRHQHILSVSDHGVIVNEKQSSPFYVMPLFDGSLRDILASGIPADRVLYYFAQILDGVEAAHLQSVIHRDLKPENILYRASEDHLIVADFGIAHFEEDVLHTAVETKDETRLANFQYAAPEQRVRGMGQDRRTDIYALGLMLNEMFTAEIVSGTGHKMIATVAPEYEYLDDMVDKMLRQSLKERPDSIEEIKMQLIGRKEEYVIRQRLSELQRTVVPVSDLDDPLISDPLRIVDVDWNKGTLTINFQQPVNPQWIIALNNMGNYESAFGIGPEVFKFRGEKAMVGASERDAPRVLKYFRQWLPKANAVYEQRLRQSKKAEEREQRKELERQIEEQEARQRVLRNIKLPEV